MLFVHRFRCVLTLLPLLLAAACTDSLLPGPDRYELPAPDSSLDPGSLVIGEVIAACSGNPEHRASSERVLVDIFFGRRSESDPADRPLPEHIRAVTSRGGKVLHHFNVPAVRARIDLNQIPDLVEREFFAHVRAVPDPRRFDLPVFVGYAHGVQSSDLATITQLGGRVTREFRSFDAIAAELPDRSLPVLRAVAGVRYVEYSGVGCLLVQAGSETHS
jgi:hypothetical protein